MSFGRLERPSSADPMSDINMTPLIDVMLVLLVIFIVTAPLMSSSLKLELPRTDAAAPVDKPVAVKIAIDREGQLYFDEKPLSREAFEQRVAEAGRANASAEVHLRADRAVAYGEVAELIGMVQKAGLTRIGFVTEPAAPR